MLYTGINLLHPRQCKTGLGIPAPVITVDEEFRFGHAPLLLLI